MLCTNMPGRPFYTPACAAGHAGRTLTTIRLSPSNIGSSGKYPNATLTVRAACLAVLDAGAPATTARPALLERQDFCVAGTMLIRNKLCSPAQSTSRPEHTSRIKRVNCWQRLQTRQHTKLWRHAHQGYEATLTFSPWSYYEPS